MHGRLRLATVLFALALPATSAAQPPGEDSLWGPPSGTPSPPASARHRTSCSGAASATTATTRSPTIAAGLRAALQARADYLA